MSSNSMETNSNEIVEQLPSKIKSHFPAHLQPRAKKPLKSSSDVNQSNGDSTPAAVIKLLLLLVIIHINRYFLSFY